jgi:hypothetical protein
MTTRRFQRSHSPVSDGFSARSVPWLSIGMALSAILICGAVFAFVSAQPSQSLPGAGWLGSAKGPSLSEAFGAAQPSADAMRRPAKWLSGIGAQTFSPGARQNTLAEAELPQIGPNISPVAWDRLSAGDCITVTAKSGQTFSFRILGARPTGAPEQPDNLPKIELAVSGCADMSESVVKAVIQPTNPAPKAANAERTL